MKQRYARRGAFQRTLTQWGEIVAADASPAVRARLANGPAPDSGRGFQIKF